MFLSKDDLKLAYGVELEIGSSYVNRRVPEGNLYWSNRKVYIPEAPGYYFMPIFSDLMYRHGIPQTILLEEQTFTITEQILHAAAQLEYNQTDWPGHIQILSQQLNPFIKNEELFQEILSYLHVSSGRPRKHGRLGTVFPSLNRADSYLLLLSCLPLLSVSMLDGILRSWYAMMTYFLILDDLVDIKDDLRNNDENSLLEAGLNEYGISVIERMISESHDWLITINPVLANRIDHKRKTMDLTGLIRSIHSE